MERTATIVAIVLALPLGGWVAFRAVQNPMDEKRVRLESDLADIKVSNVEIATVQNFDFELLQRSISAKPKLWQELIPKPVPVKKPQKPRKEVRPPNMIQMLDKVKPSRAGIKKSGKMLARIILPSHPKGKMFAEGDVVSGLTILSIDKTHVTFGIERNGKMYTHKLERK